MHVVIPQEHFSPRDTERYDVPVAYTPTVSLRLVSDAAWILGHTPDMELSIDPTYHSYTVDGTGSDILHDVVDQTQRGTRNPYAPTFNAMSGELESCAKAEARLLQALRHPEYPAEEEQSLRIVVDERGEPLLVQKNVDHRATGVNLGLSLQNLTVGKVTWLPGMLVQVSSPHRIESAEPVTIIQPDKIARLGVLRASMFALPTFERSAFLADTVRFNDRDARVMGNITMDEIRDYVYALVHNELPLEKVR